MDDSSNQSLCAGQSSEDIESCGFKTTCSRSCLKPCVPTYSPVNIKNIKVGSVYQWCTCGLSKTQPWCDNTHIGTGFKPLKWIAPGTKKDGKPQQIYSICACKYTTDPPYCDASHIHLPMQYIKAQRECIKDHANIKKMCTACGFKASELKANEPSGST